MVSLESRLSAQVEFPGDSSQPYSSHSKSESDGDEKAALSLLASPDKPNVISPTVSRHSMGEVQVFISTFLTIFCAELGDKTQLTTLLMAAESKSPWIVFAGSGAALVLTSLLGILIGRWLASRVHPKTLETCAGTLLLLISVLLLWDIVHL